MNISNPYALFGHMIQTRGLYGQVVAQLEAPIKTLDPVTFIFIQIGHTYVPYQIEEKFLSQPDQAWLRIQGITDRSTAHEVIDKSIWLDQDLLNKILVKLTSQDPIVGYDVKDINAGKLGIVKRIEEFPMHSCLVVDYQGSELLIPYVSTLIKELDKTHQKLTIELPLGFLEAMGCK